MRPRDRPGDDRAHPAAEPGGRVVRELPRAAMGSGGRSSRESDADRVRTRTQPGKRIVCREAPRLCEKRICAHESNTRARARRVDSRSPGEAPAGAVQARRAPLAGGFRGMTRGAPRTGRAYCGSRRKFLKNESFNEIFSESWRRKILESEPWCEPVGWKGFMLANGLIRYEGVDTFGMTPIRGAEWPSEYIEYEMMAELPTSGAQFSRRCTTDPPGPHRGSPNSLVHDSRRYRVADMALATYPARLGQVQETSPEDRTADRGRLSGIPCVERYGIGVQEKDRTHPTFNGVPSPVN